MSSLNDLVSVLIPVYNSEKFLTESIESVLAQSYKNIEVIVIDDGSTDDSLKLLKQYENKITIISQKNMGLGGAMNNGVKKMRGKWLKWFSDDDILYPNAIEVLVNEAKKLPLDTIVYSNWDIMDENGQKLRAFSESNYNNLDIFDFNVRLLDGQQININTCLIPFSLFTKGCVIENLDDAVAIDYNFFLKAGMLFNTKFHLVTNQLVCYRVHKQQLSHKKILDTLSYLYTVRNSVLSKLDKSKKEEYLVALEKYKKNKPIHKKIAELGLQIMGKTLPSCVTDNILVFYLNKIRTTR